MSILRNKSPELALPEKIIIPEAVISTLDNGLRIYEIHSGEEKVLKLEMIFPSRAQTRDQLLMAMAAHQLIDAGTPRMDAAAIAESFDYYGAYLKTEAGPDFKSISLYCLSKFFPDTLPLLREILLEANFPDHEVLNWKTRSIQNYRVNCDKVSWLSRTFFNEKIFEGHIYGFSPKDEDYEKVNPQNIRDFFSHGYDFGNAVIILAGNYDTGTVTLLNKIFGQDPVPVPEPSTTNAVFSSSPGKFRVDKPNALQAGIRVGKKMFGKQHPDYLGMSIVNTILGGYFGSRLMSNIREDKGYTYGIGSGIMPLLGTGSFFISTEVGKEVCEAALNEIYKELEKLTKEPVSNDELTLVRNYLAGSFQRSIDGPFAQAERFKGLILYGLNTSYLYEYLELLKTITPLKVMELANKHLQPNTMTEVVAG
jgi:zinc protease